MLVQHPRSQSLTWPGDRSGIVVKVFGETHDQATCFARHSHADLAQLIHTKRGVIQIRTPRMAWNVPPGRAIYIPPGIEHELIIKSAAQVRTLNVERGQLPLATQQCRVLNISPLMICLIDAVGEMPDEQRFGAAEQRLILVLLDQIAAAPEEPTFIPLPQDNRARRIADRLMSDPGNAMSLDEWGHLVGASRRTLARTFMAETGMSFRDFRWRIQIHAAIAKLADGETITNVAFDLGYQSPSAFIHAFKKTTGLTPGKYA